MGLERYEKAKKGGGLGNGIRQQASQKEGEKAAVGQGMISVDGDGACLKPLPEGGGEALRGLGIPATCMCGEWKDLRRSRLR